MPPTMLEQQSESSWPSGSILSTAAARTTTASARTDGLLESAGQPFVLANDRGSPGADCHRNRRDDHRRRSSSSIDNAGSGVHQDVEPDAAGSESAAALGRAAGRGSSGGRGGRGSRGGRGRSAFAARTGSAAACCLRF
eukprot:1052270-Pleurochrysis_carterae.AAC.4